VLDTEAGLVDKNVTEVIEFLQRKHYISAGP
jgi:hypothetical protein